MKTLFEQEEEIFNKKSKSHFFKWLFYYFNLFVLECMSILAHLWTHLAHSNPCMKAGKVLELLEELQQLGMN